MFRVLFGAVVTSFKTLLLSLWTDFCYYPFHPGMWHIMQFMNCLRWELFFWEIRSTLLPLKKKEKLYSGEKEVGTTLRLRRKYSTMKISKSDSVTQSLNTVTKLQITAHISDMVEVKGFLKNILSGMDLLNKTRGLLFSVWDRKVCQTPLESSSVLKSDVET